jgi:two-component system phosphate regulon sensor histidine kinase PhoR
MIFCLLFLWLFTVLFYELQHRKIKTSEAEKAQILESLEEGVVAVDAELRIGSINYAASRMFDLPKRELIGQLLQARGGLFDKASALLTESLKRESVLTDSFASDKIYFDLIAVPKKQGRGALLILQNKSAHYKVLDVGKDFITNASHELRTPITIIKGFAETLQDMPELPHEMVADITEKIVRNCQRMDLLVKNLLTLADLENLPSLRLQECDLVALLENCQHLLLAAHPTTKLQIEKKKSDVTIFADPDILELALMNLLENAVKYSTGPAAITIGIEKIKEKVKVSIADQGIGIPQESLERIFSRFYTVDKARSRRLGGAGLGLSIVKTIIEKHDGEIRASSELGKGSTFTVTLPQKL